jgi:gliding motility-associated-like protein
VEYQPCECKVYMANAFSPNGDSRNDEFYPVAHCNPTQVSFSIFNRWGQLVFQGASFDDRWDGTYNGQAVPEGVYVWVINYSWEEGGFPQQAQQKGTVTLIR